MRTYSLLRWTDDKGNLHIMRGYLDEIQDHIEDVAQCGFDYKVITFETLCKAGGWND